MRTDGTTGPDVLLGRVSAALARRVSLLPERLPAAIVAALATLTCVGFQKIETAADADAEIQRAVSNVEFFSSGARRPDPVKVADWAGYGLEMTARRLALPPGLPAGALDNRRRYFEEQALRAIDRLLADFRRGPAERGEPPSPSISAVTEALRVCARVRRSLPEPSARRAVVQRELSLAGLGLQAANASLQDAEAPGESVLGLTEAIRGAVEAANEVRDKPPDLLETAAAGLRLSYVCAGKAFGAGDLPAAQRLAETALRIALEVESPDAALCLFWLEFYQFEHARRLAGAQGFSAGAEALSGAVRRNSELLRGGDLDGPLLRGDLFLAKLALVNGRLSQAGEILRDPQAEPAALSRKLPLPFLIAYWSLRADLEYQERNLASAHRSCQELLKLGEGDESLGPAEINALRLSAMVQRSQGDFEGARLAFEKVLQRIVDDPVMRNEPQRPETELQLAMVYYALHLFDRAVDLLDAAGRHTSDSRLQGHIHNNLGMCYYARGDFAEAEKELELAREHHARSFGEESLSVAEVDVNRGWLRAEAGEWSEAAALFADALAAARASVGDEHPRTAEMLSYQARALNEVGRTAEAAAGIADAQRLRVQWLRRTLQTALSARDRLAIVHELRSHRESSAWPGVLDTYLDLAPALGISEKEQYGTLLQWKGTLAHVITDGSDRGARYNEVLVELRDLAAKRQSSVLAGQAAPEQDLARIAELEREANRLERALLHDRRAELLEGAGVDEVAASLPANAALLDIVETRHFRRRSPGQAVNPGREYLAFLAFPDGTIRRLEFGDAGTIDAAIQEFVGAIIGGEHAEEVLRRGEPLGQLFANGLRQHLIGIDLLIVSGDGWFTRLPWAALPGAEKQFWIEETAFATVPSAHSLARRAAQPDRPDRPQMDWLLIGYVHYGDPRAARGRQVVFEPLPESWFEIEAAGELLRQRFPEAAGTRLNGSQATKARFLELLQKQPKLVHLATHGFFAVPPAGDEGRALDVSAEMDSALVFADANTTEREARTRVTAEELSQLNLDGVELLVLSACETSLGHMTQGQGTIGLLNALDRAGVRAVVSALWQVPDTDTSDLMQAFYQYLISDEQLLRPAAALRAAQLEVLNGPERARFRKFPKRWAAWTVTGAPGAAAAASDQK